MEYPSTWLRGASLGEKIACELRLRIIKGRIKPGTVLSENHIASEFGTSRSPVRDSLKALANDGLIRLERMGAVVLGLSSKDLEELYDIRFLIENFVLQRLLKENNDSLIHSLNKIVDIMGIAAKHDDFVELSYQDLAFHETIIIKANHTRILHLWNSIRPIVLTALFVATEQRFTIKKHEIQSVIDSHCFLISALQTKDEIYIERIVQEHFDDMRKTVTSSIRIVNSNV